MSKITKEKFKTYGNVFDEHTINLLFKLSTQGYFEELKSAISMGKEANIFTATRKDGSHIIVKIYRLENCNFNGMFNYIKTDPRYAHLKGKKRKIIFEWVKREFRNLTKSRDAGVRVPTPIFFKDNIILMNIIGTQEDVAPQAKNSLIDEPVEFMNELLHQMKVLYQDARLVHGDLSMYNILVFDQKPVLIDMSQTTAFDDPHAREYLIRDIKNITFMAKRMGVELDVDEVLADILKKEV
jgi:RIO kinase 1